MRKSKYKPLADYLSASNKNSVSLTFNQIEKILGFKLPPSSRKYRANWSNNKMEALAWGWLPVGYESFDVRMSDEIANFTKVGNKLKSEKSKKSNRKQNSDLKRQIENATDLIFLDVPNNLLKLEVDEYYMVKLTKTNSEIVEHELANDISYPQKAKKICEELIKRNNDFSSETFNIIIHRIAIENSTRSSKNTIDLLTDFALNSENQFLQRVKKGDLTLVDDITDYLFKNNNRRDKSLASKVCRYLNEWLFDKDDFTINDSVVRKVLPYYLAYYKIEKHYWANKNLDKLTYVEFFAIFEKIKEKLPELTRHELDHLLWYSYKNDNIRSTIAASLAKHL